MNIDSYEHCRRILGHDNNNIQTFSAFNTPSTRVGSVEMMKLFSNVNLEAIMELW